MQAYQYTKYQKIHHISEQMETPWDRSSQLGTRTEGGIGAMKQNKYLIIGHMIHVKYYNPNSNYRQVAYAFQHQRRSKTSTISQE
jgi:hypothetical protein